MTSTSITISIKGAVDTAEKLGKTSEEVLMAVSRGLKTGALDVTLDAKRLCPVDTGRLMTSIKPNMKNLLDFVVYSDVEYAIHQEFGTTKHKAQSYLRPALHINANNIKELIIEEINNI